MLYRFCSNVSCRKTTLQCCTASMGASHSVWVAKGVSKRGIRNKSRSPYGFTPYGDVRAFSASHASRGRWNGARWCIRVRVVPRSMWLWTHKVLYSLVSSAQWRDEGLLYGFAFIGPTPNGPFYKRYYFFFGTIIDQPRSTTS